MFRSIVLRKLARRPTTAARQIQSASSKFKPVYGAFIDGEECINSTQKDRYVLRSPATRQALCEVVNTSAEETARAVEVAQRTFESGVWSRADVRARAKILTDIAHALRQKLPHFHELESLQTGRPIREMKAQLGRLPEWFDYYSAMIRTMEGTVPPFLGNYLNYVERVPLGVCGLVTPWNHPLLIAIKKLAPALAAGNSVVLKPSELAPVSVLELGKILEGAGLPKGVLNIVPGTGPVTGQTLCTHPHMRKIDLTGGTTTGRVVGRLAGENLCQVTSELGGKAAMIIFPDCDLEQAVNGAAFASFIASGQTCIMGARLIIHDSLYETFMKKLAEKVARIRMGDPLEDSTQMGPVISQASLNKVSTMVRTALERDGAVRWTGGQLPSESGLSLPESCREGFYYPPTVLGVNTKAEIWREEVFGPVVVGTPFHTEKEAIALNNDSPYGLAAAVWTKDVARAHRVARQLSVGIVWINDHHRNDPSSPWGGMKHSGIGRENGLAAYHEYTQTRSVVVRTDDAAFDWFEQANARYS